MDIKHIDYGKLPIIEIFSDWYTVPSYQRHYVWDTDNVMDLLCDFKEAIDTHPNDEYFLGSYIYQSNVGEKNKDLLDGQQRITTLFLIFAYLRDCGNLDENMKQTLHGFVYQDENKLARKNAKVRLQYEIRGDVGDFIQEHIVGKGIFSPEQRNVYTHKIGNLCILTRKKNSMISNLDYHDKKSRYFTGKIDTMPRTLHIISSHGTWHLSDLEQNQRKSLEDISHDFRNRWIFHTADLLLRYTDMTVDEVARCSGADTRTNLYFIYERDLNTSPTTRRNALHKPGECGRYKIVEQK